MEAIVYSSSSRNAPLIDHDGARRVHCWQCGQYICTTLAPIGKALCELCRRALDGEKLTPDAIQQYKLGKQGRTGVSMIVLADEPPATVKRFTLRSMGGEILKAIGLTPKQDETAKLPSVAASKAKRSGRLFEHVDDLGSIEEFEQRAAQEKK